jgi:hypothetical protein
MTLAQSPLTVDEELLIELNASLAGDTPPEALEPELPEARMDDEIHVVDLTDDGVLLVFEGDTIRDTEHETVDRDVVESLGEDSE